MGKIYQNKASRAFKYVWLVLVLAACQPAAAPVSAEEVVPLHYAYSQSQLLRRAASLAERRATDPVVRGLAIQTHQYFAYVNLRLRQLQEAQKEPTGKDLTAEDHQQWAYLNGCSAEYFDVQYLQWLLHTCQNAQQHYAALDTTATSPEVRALAQDIIATLPVKLEQFSVCLRYQREKPDILQEPPPPKSLSTSI